MATRRCLLAAMLLLGLVAPAVAQHVERMNVDVVPYYDDADVAKQNYRESPYYQELSGTWKQKNTDSSILYTKHVVAEKVWKEYKVYLNVRCGRAARVLVNDKEVGVGSDSRHYNAFCIDKWLRYGKENKITIEALKRPDDAQVEDAALEVGLNGEPFLMFKTDPMVASFAVVTDYDAERNEGTLNVDAVVSNSKRRGRYYMEVEIVDPRGRQLDRMGRWVVFEKSEETVNLSRLWNGVSPWNAEKPTLYTAIVRLRNEKMEELETIGQRFGFRTVQVKDGVLMVNGKAVTLKGVTYGVEHTEGTASREKMRRDVLTMKKNNINAVRTSRYSPMEPYFYALCDEYGLYVVADANIMPTSTQQHAVATDADYIPMFEQRVENLYYDCRNHSSVVMWSLGNTRDNGVCMTAAYRRLKSLDKTRPVMFAGADYGEATDVIAPVLPEEKTLRAALKKKSERPTIMAVMADGTHFEQLANLWQLVESQHALQGGFIDCWPMDATMLADVRQLFGSFDISVSKLSADQGEFVVYNNNDFTDFGDYTLEYAIYTTRRPSVIAGDLTMSAPAGGSDKVRMRIPQLDMAAGEEMYVRFNVGSRKKSGSPWQDGAIVESIVLPIAKSKAAKSMPHYGVEQCDTTYLPCTLLFEGHDDWKAVPIGSKVRWQGDSVRCTDKMWQYQTRSGAIACEVRETYATLSSGDVVVDYVIEPSSKIIDTALRAVVQLDWRADSLLVLGERREVRLKNDMPRMRQEVGVWHNAVGTGIERNGVRWCALQGNDGVLYAEAVGEICRVAASGDGVRIAFEERGKTHRVHLKKTTVDEAADCYTVALPQTTMALLSAPVITATEARFSKPMSVSMSAAKGSQIRYTLDGSEPDESSELYKSAITLTATTVVKAKAFATGREPSFTATREFNYDYIVKTTFSRKPNTPYNRKYETALFDGEKGSVDELSRSWIGFSGGDMEMCVELAHAIDVDAVVLRYAHSPQLWAFAPKRVRVAFSADGVTYTDTVEVSGLFDPSEEENATPQIVELRVPAEKSDVGYIKVMASPIGRLPEWHRAVGLKPWLMMDEVEVIETNVSNKDL